MAKLTGSVWIDGPVEAVEAAGIDVAGWPGWVPSLQHAEVSPGFPAPGETARVALRQMGFTLHMTLRVRERTPGQSIVFEMVGRFVDGLNTWTFTPQDGGTEVSCVMAFDIPGGPVGESIYRRLVGPLLARALEEILSNLADRVEGPAAPG